MTFPQRCDELIAHHQRRCGEVLHILGSEPSLTAWDIAARMTWRIRARDWADFPTPQKWFAVGEAMAHLDHLAALDQVERYRDGELYRYRLTDQTSG